MAMNITLRVKFNIFLVCKNINLDIFHISAEATLTFETELVNLEKKSVEESVFNILRFLSVPAMVTFLNY